MRVRRERTTIMEASPSLARFASLYPFVAQTAEMAFARATQRPNHALQTTADGRLSCNRSVHIGGV